MNSKVNYFRFCFLSLASIVGLISARKKWLISFIFFSFFASSQNFKGVYKIDPLLKRIDNTDTTYVINFWATWCKPCIEELPAFDSLLTQKNKSVKIILVSLDFKEDLETKVLPFLKKHALKTDCILLDEINGNDFINKISPTWSGAIPATLFKKGDKKEFVEAKLKLSELNEKLKTLGKTDH